MLKVVAKDSLIYSVAQGFALGLPLLLMPVFSRRLSPAEYGAFEFVSVLMVFAGFLSSLELSQGMARCFADCTNRDERCSFASTGFWITCALSLLLLVVAWPLSSWLAPQNGSAVSMQLLVTAIVAVAFTNVYNFLLQALRWDLRAGQFGVAVVVYAVVYVVGSVCLLALFELQAAGILIAQSIAALIGGLAGYFLGRDNIKGLFSTHAAGAMLKFSLPLIPSSVCVLIAASADRIMIQTLVGEEAVGVYSAGLRLASLLGISLVGLNFALTPHVYRNLNSPHARIEVARLFRLFMAVFLAFLLLLTLFAQHIMRLLAPAAYQDAYIVVPVVGAAMIIARCYVFTPGLDVARKTPTIALLNMLGGFGALTLNAVFIPKLGIFGAGLAMFTNSLGIFLLYAFLAQRQLAVPFDVRRLVSAGMLATVFVVVNTRLSAVWPLILLLSLGVLQSLAVAAILIRPHEIRSFGRWIGLSR